MKPELANSGCFTTHASRREAIITESLYEGKQGNEAVEYDAGEIMSREEKLNCCILS